MQRVKNIRTKERKIIKGRRKTKLRIIACKV